MPKTETGRLQSLKRNVCPDKLDLRDRPYMPSVAQAPRPVLKPAVRLPVLNQRETSACTGFALASVVNFLLRDHGGSSTPAEQVSPFMIYSMARRYDDIPGSDAVTGSSLRGAMKGWFKHGVCRLDLWKSLDMPPAEEDPTQDWWEDAATRPLGAYYRVDTRSVTDMQVALTEVGILYASAICHSGWLKSPEPAESEGDYWTIPLEPPSADDGGHAFAIVGYDNRGFIIQNSWGNSWGTRGLARLTYEDWTRNAMDCWVAQRGVVTEQHREIAGSPSLRIHDGKVRISSDQILRAREIAPFIIDMENNGQLSSTGDFRTQASDLDALVNLHLSAARKNWGVATNEPIDVAIYAHGGLTGEDAALETASRWVPACYEAKIFPIFFMWETDMYSTLKDRFEDLVMGLPKPIGGLGDQLKRFWNQRLERTLAAPGSVLWDEMKQNAESISNTENSGGVLLYQSAMKSPHFRPDLVRLHLIGHSAGSIVHSFLVRELANRGWKFESVNFLAAAVSVKTFQKTALQRVEDGSVKCLRVFHLADETEQKDPTCRMLFGYGRSLLYLVSESFEHGARTPILGMQKYFDQSIGALNLPNVQAFVAPGPSTTSTTHGGFDDDAATMHSVINLIRAGNASGAARGRSTRTATAK